MATLQALERPCRRAQGLLQHRCELAREPAPDDTAGPPLRRFLGELACVAEPFRRSSGGIRVMQRRSPAHGHAAARFRHASDAHALHGAAARERWAQGQALGAGLQLGPTEENFAALERRVSDWRERHGEPVVLVGWSLGGLFAREIAKRHPDCVAKVVTMGSPFSLQPACQQCLARLSPRHRSPGGGAAGGGRAGGQAAGRDGGDVEPARRDRSARARRAGSPGERDREVALRCTHMGFANDPEVHRRRPAGTRRADDACPCSRVHWRRARLSYGH